MTDDELKALNPRLDLRAYRKFLQDRDSVGSLFAASSGRYQSFWEMLSEDELTVFPEDGVARSLARCSSPGLARGVSNQRVPILNCNPDMGYCPADTYQRRFYGHPGRSLPDLYICDRAYQSWFDIFFDAVGIWIEVYYPTTPPRYGERLIAPVIAPFASDRLWPIHGTDLFGVPWLHGVDGLAEAVFEIYWLDCAIESICEMTWEYMMSYLESCESRWKGQLDLRESSSSLEDAFGHQWSGGFTSR